MTPTSPSQVAIFWDYENCRPSNDSDGNKVIDRIQCIVQGFGSITTFRAYLDLSLDCAYSRSVTLHSDLQSSGLTLVHCPHNGKKDVADKMMIVDMLAFAIDKPTPACIVLITGDRDFAYAAAILKLRGYRIIVISPTYNSHSSLKVQAHELYDWQNDVLGTAGGTSSAISPRGHKSIGSVASASQMNEVLLSGATGPSVSQEQGCMESITLIGAQAGEFRSLTRDLNASGSCPLKPERASQSLSHSCVEHTIPPPTFDVTPTTTARVDNASSLFGDTVNALLADEVPVSIGVSAEDARSTNTTRRIPPVTESQVAAASSFVEPIPSAEPNNDHETMSLLSTSDTSNPSSESSLTSEPISASPYYDSLSSGGSWAVSDALNPFRRQEGPGAVGNTTPQVRSTSSFAGVSEVEGSEATMASRSNADTIDSVTMDTSRIHSDASTDSSEARTVPLNPFAASFRPTVQTGQTTSSETPTTPIPGATLGVPTPTENDRERFQTLIQFFIERRASGQSTRIRSYEVATKIRKRDPQVYEKAGVTKLKTYIEEARKAGVIISPEMDKQGSTWVEVNTSLYPSTQVATTQTAKDKASPATPAGQTSPPSTKTSQPSSSGWIYAPLTSRLRQETPSYRVLYSKLGEFFGKYHADLYQRAAVSGLSAYLEKALNLGIIRIGTEGLPGTEWAELMPAYRGAVFGG